MATEDMMKLRIKAQFYMSMASGTVANWMARNNIYTEDEKRQIFETAKIFTRIRQDGRIYWEDVQRAIRLLRQEGKIK